MGNYSKIAIVSMALGRIGAPKITSLADGSVAANQADLVYDMVRDEVLEAADWNFATVRAALSQSTTAPAQGYDFAYPLPADFLRLATDKADDPRVYPSDVPYTIEALNDGTKCLFTGYDNTAGDLYIRYARREANQALWSASFINAFAWRLGAELAAVIAESRSKRADALEMYGQAIQAAVGLSRSGDSLTDETGSDSWVGAGR